MTSQESNAKCKLDEFYYLDLSHEPTRNAIKRASAPARFNVKVKLIANPAAPSLPATATLNPSGDEIIIETMTGSGVVQHQRGLQELMIDIASIERFS